MASSTPKSAKSPYDSTALANVILRSSDNTDFYVLRDFLRYVSPIFKDMFDLPPTEENQRKGDLPIIPVSETDKTLQALLDFIYPGGDQPLTDTTLFIDASKAAQKYCMNIIEDKLRHQVPIWFKDPLRIYAIAIDLGWEDVAIAAARSASKIPLDKLTYIEELKNISGSDFYRFLEYKFRYDKSLHLERDELIKLPAVAAKSGSSSDNGRRIANIPNRLDPFGSTANADTILRSSDGVDFFVLGELILRTSPVLKSILLTRTTTSDKTRNIRAIIDIAESSEVLRPLLTLMYPIQDGLDMRHTQLYVQVCQAAGRYGITAIVNRLRKQAAASPFISEEPLRMYLVASALGWDEIAKAAALNTFSSPLKVPYMEEFNLVTGADLFRLVSFRFRCADAAWEIIDGNPEYDEYGPGKWYREDVSSMYQHLGPTDWLFERLKCCPRGSTIREAYDLEDKSLQDKDGEISMHGPSLLKVLYYRRKIEDAVETAVAKVPLYIDIS